MILESLEKKGKLYLFSTLLYLVVTQNFLVKCNGYINFGIDVTFLSRFHIEDYFF